MPTTVDVGTDSGRVLLNGIKFLDTSTPAPHGLVSTIGGENSTPDRSESSGGYTSALGSNIRYFHLRPRITASNRLPLDTYRVLSAVTLGPISEAVSHAII